MSKPLKYWILPALFCAAVLHGCGSSPPSPDADRHTASAREEPVRPTDAPPPPGVPARALSPISADQQARAQLTLDEIVASLTPPPHLAPGGSDTPEGGAAPVPPLTAQKFYATGRQALLDGDNFAAVQAFEKALRLSPNEASILRGLGQAWARAGNRVSAANHYRRAFAADPTDLDSVFMLGRFAIDNRRWESAVLNFDTTRRLADSEAQTASTNSDTQRLSRFYLANALNQAGYARAALSMYHEYLADADRRSSGHSRYARELSIIDAQQGETLAIMGDLHHRLGEPELARDVYRLAAEVGVLNPDALRRRLLYTRLRLGQPRAAEAIVAQAVADSRGDTRVVELIRYAVAQGVPADRLSGRMTELYDDQGKPAALALALADVLPPADAVSLLSRHLQTHPGDDEVFGKLLALSLSRDGKGRSNAENAAALISTTVDAMVARPDLADRYSRQLLDNLENPAALLANYPEYREPLSNDAASASPEAVSRRAMTALLHGQLLAAAGQPDQAAEAYRSALNHDPDLHPARVELAAFHLRREDYGRVEELLAPLGDKAPQQAIELRARALIQTERYDEALAMLNQALQNAPPGSRLMLDKAALLTQLDRVPEAERTLLDALNARPTDENIYIALLKLYDRQSGLQRNKARLIRRMFETIPHATLTRFIKAEYLLADRNYNDALQVLTLLSEAGADSQRITRLRLEAYVGLKRPDRILALAQEHLDNAGDSPDNDLMNRVFNHLYRTGLRNKDQTLVDQALSLEARRWIIQPPSVRRSRILSEVYLTQKRYEDATTAAREALALSETVKDQLDSKLLLITGLFRTERLDEAEQILADAIKDAPEGGGDLSFSLALLYDEAGDTAASRRVLDEGLKKYPMHASMNNTLGYGLANDGIRLQEARVMIERALEIHPDEPAYLDSLGWVYYKLGEFDQALDWLERSRAAIPNVNPVILDHLGDTLYRLGREPEAVRAWTQARMKMLSPNYVMLDPEEEGLEDRLALKINAVAEDRPAPVAALGRGIVLANPEAELNPEAGSEPAPEAVADPTIPDAAVGPADSR
ncbi:MAG: tetratricopeptide repeat protein [Planctomycetota bacterium]